MVLHRAILGSLDRFMAFLIEETAGNFPTWLAPEQVRVLPITDRTMDASHAIAEQLQKAGIRVEVDDRNEKLGYKIREAQMMKVPYMLVIGDRDVENGVVSVRSRNRGDLGAMTLEQFQAMVQKEIDEKAM